ncbi:ATP-binding protein [Leptolyngbya sp. FACHB-261]|uniref:ATP-binding protein n=1 Tax=Leptolyngbya sp. FACHB-261 TaxID=2692806 RepID=UPI001687184A|nr:ATP-binding protein [Leptolyngbya sp. FACHB-261]
MAGPPVGHPRRFFGREQQLKRLFNLLKRTPLQNAAIIGPRRSGKTSLLLHLKQVTTTPVEQLRPGQRSDWLLKPESFCWVFVDFQDCRLGSREGLLRYLLACLKLPIPYPCDLDRFLEVVSNHLRIPTVILLDEIGVALHRYAELNDAFWEGLRSLATNQVGGKLSFILATHESPLDLAQHTGHSSPFFNIFAYTTTLGPLLEPEAHALIASSPIPFPDADIEWILTQSSGWPILLQILCRERLFSLEEGDLSDDWREEGLQQLKPFAHLLA